MSLGLYVSVPFCRTKCSYCNFASQVFSAKLHDEYCELLAREIGLAAATDGVEGGAVDTIYWGGGTPSLLPPEGFAAIVAAIGDHFLVAPNCEHTVEVAPGTLTPAILDAFGAAGVNRVSLGAQSFQDAEARAVGRLHQRATVLADLERLRQAGVDNLNLDLIAGLPHQTLASWRESLAVALATGVPHLSVYMLEVDEDSRLGSELLAGGARYHAHAVPDDDLIAEAYEIACQELDLHGRPQYEISNFARPGSESRHNERYWLRRPYLGFGLDAHSFLRQPTAVRFANPDRLDDYLEPLRHHRLPRQAAERLTPIGELEEKFFLGLRRTAGVAEAEMAAAAVPGFRAWFEPRLQRLVDDGLLRRDGGHIALTQRGRLLSNQVFAECLGFVSGPAPDGVTLAKCEDVSAPRA